MKTVYIESSSTNPAYNLALEQYVFDCMPKDRSYFWLWQNDCAIVVGKHQNTVEEINQAYVKAHGISVVRRLSGGGAVYHDLGNVNFTFIADAGNLETLNLQAFCVPVVETLEKIGVHAQASGRNDISIEGKKFSGNSQYVKKGRIMHHGTLMFDSDLSVVSQALMVSKDKYESKGFKSVRSRVTNIRPYVPGDMDIREFIDILKTNMVKGQEVEIYRPTEEDVARIQEIQRERYDTWGWNYGESPDYSVRRKKRFEGCGQVELCLRVEQGHLVDFESFGDFFGEGATEELKNRLKGCRMEEGDLRKRLEGFPLDLCYSHMEKEDFISLFL